MRAVRLIEPGQPLALTEVPEPIAGSGECVIDVLACGICHSDLHAVAGDYPTTLPVTLGHEVVGRHDTLGNVLVYAPWGCRRPGCVACDSEREMICPDSTEAGLIRDGGYAERMLVPDERYLVPIADLDPAASAPLACGGLTAFRAVGHAIPVLASVQRPRALVIGAGGLGQFGLQLIKAQSDAEVVVLDASPTKRDQALALGADAAVAPGEVEGGFTAVIDFVGADATLATATSHVARQGIVVLVGLYGGRVPFGLGAVPHEARLMTSIWGTLGQLHELVALVQTHGIRSEVELIGMTEIAAAHDRLHRGEVRGRFVVDPRLGGTP